MRLCEVNPWTDRDVEAHWDRVAHIYVDTNAKVAGTHDQRFACAVQSLNLQPHDSVLNITSRDCGAHAPLKAACPDIDITHAEISTGLMRVAEKICPDARQVKLDNYESLPFRDNQFTRILSLETLEHVAKPIAFLLELHRVTQPNGILVLSCPPATCELAYRVYTTFFGGHGEGPHRFPSSRLVKTMLHRSHWQLTHHEGTLLFPVGPKWFKQMGERIIERAQGTLISELGIRQFYVCRKN